MTRGPARRVGGAPPGGSLPRERRSGRLLVAAGLTVAVAEPCIGGLLGAALTAVPGSSGYMRGGIIAYADPVKVHLLAVEPELLERVGAVSPEVAAAMAQGTARRLGADLGLAITGVAGPGAPTTRKPVGLIYVAGVAAGPGPGGGAARARWARGEPRRCGACRPGPGRGAGRDRLPGPPAQTGSGDH